MKSAQTMPPHFQPNEITALFMPSASELTLSPAGLYYLGVVKQSESAT